MPNPMQSEPVALPCPLCGGTADIIGSGPGEYGLRCRDCWSTTNLAQAVRASNRRAFPSPQGEAQGLEALGQAYMDNVETQVHVPEEWKIAARKAADSLATAFSAEDAQGEAQGLVGRVEAQIAWAVKNCPNAPYVPLAIDDARQATALITAQAAELARIRSNPNG